MMSKDLLQFTSGALKTAVLVLYYVVIAAFSWVLPTKYKNIEEDIILITGGGRGLGRALALEFCKYKPKHIVLWGRHSNTLSSTCEEVKRRGVDCTYMECDVSDRTQIYTQASRVVGSVGEVTILVNNAGVVFGKPLLDSRDEDIDKTLRVNTLSHFWTLKSFMPAMVRRNHGHIVTMDSMLGLTGLNGAGDYSTSKYASSGLAEALHAELSEGSESSGVHVTIVYPYQVSNDMFAGCRPRFPTLFPPITEEFVAKETVFAILTNQVQVLLPRTMHLLWFTKSIFPVPVLLMCFKFLGVDKVMSTFEGGARAAGNKGNDD